MSNYIFGSQGFPNGSVQNTKQLYYPDKNNFGPRAFRYTRRYGAKAVIRGGFGSALQPAVQYGICKYARNLRFRAGWLLCFFDPGQINGPPPGSGMLYGIGSSGARLVMPQSQFCLRLGTRWSTLRRCRLRFSHQSGYLRRPSPRAHAVCVCVCATDRAEP